MKGNTLKVRRLGKRNIIAGFADAVADALTLLESLEAKLEQYPDQLTRAYVEVAKDWRTNRYLRRLEATMLVSHKNIYLAVTGTCDVLESEFSVMEIGSGGHYARAAARALIDIDICVSTNHSFVIETLDTDLPVIKAWLAEPHVAEW